MVTEVKPNKIKTVFISDKSRKVAFLWCFFLGTFGAHRFYTGKIASAVIYLVATIFVYKVFGMALASIGGIILGLCVFVDLINILGCKFTDKSGKILI